MVNFKPEYRYLITERKKSKVVGFRVPKDFPLNNSEAKLIFAEMDRIIADEDLNYSKEALSLLGLTDKARKAIIKLMDYYKESKPLLEERMKELEV